MNFMHGGHNRRFHQNLRTRPLFWQSVLASDTWDCSAMPCMSMDFYPTATCGVVDGRWARPQTPVCWITSLPEA